RSFSPLRGEKVGMRGMAVSRHESRALRLVEAPPPPPPPPPPRGGGSWRPAPLPPHKHPHGRRLHPRHAPPPAAAARRAGRLRGATEQLSGLIAQAPSVDVTLDQCPCEPETAILRALLMLETGALEGRRVLILGDDDSLSLAIGLVARALGKGDLTRGVTVIESDPRRVAFLREAAAREAIVIDVVEHDLRAPLPGELARAFDTAATDPPYTLAGATLFLGRAAAALTGDGTCFFSFTRWPPAQL